MSNDLKHDINKIRNIGIIAHIDAGKTTVSERILFYTHKIHRMGEVHEGAATMDFMPEEQEHGITIASACTSCQWGDYNLNLIDTPGHVDFTIEVERSLRVLDGAIGVFCAVGGVEPQSETVWNQAEKFSIPKIAFINKMDRPGASFEAVLEVMHTKLKINPVPIVIPIGEGEDFCAIINLITMQRLDFDEESQGMKYKNSGLSKEEAALAAPWREKIIEAAADEDDAIMEAYLSGANSDLSQGALSEASIKSALRKATLARRIVPVFTGSALRNIGIQPLLDGVADLLPSPAEIPLPEFVKSFKDDAPLAALVFKVFLEDSRPISLLRLYSGSLKEGQLCLNNTKNEKERVSRIFRMHAGSHEQLDTAFAGDIIAVQGFKQARTGDSISSPDHPVMLENIAFYRPVISIALEPKNTAEGEKLDTALSRFVLEDPTVYVENNEDSGQRILSGMGELHLEVLCERLTREYNITPRTGKPQVLCQETIKNTGTASAEFEREIGEIRHYGHVTITVSPLPRGSGNNITLDFDKNSWPKLWLEAVEQGIADAMHCGVLQCSPVQDVAVSVTALQRREGASSPAGYRMAAVSALKDALNAAKPVLLEPIMRLEINVPENHLGPVMNLLTMRSAKVENLEEQGRNKLITALAPMRELFGFSTALRSTTQGRAAPSMKFDHFGVA